MLLTDGSTGENVRAVQRRLNALGYTDDSGAALDEDGEYGPCTRAAVTRFQAASGIGRTGVVGDELVAVSSTAPYGLMAALVMRSGAVRSCVGTSEFALGITGQLATDSPLAGTSEFVLSIIGDLVIETEPGLDFVQCM